MPFLQLAHFRKNQMQNKTTFKTYLKHAPYFLLMFVVISASLFLVVRCATYNSANSNPTTSAPITPTIWFLSASVVEKTIYQGEEAEFSVTTVGQGEFNRGVTVNTSNNRVARAIVSHPMPPFGPPQAIIHLTTYSLGTAIITVSTATQPIARQTTVFVTVVPNPESEPRVYGITLSTTTIEIEVGQRLNFTATPTGVGNFNTTIYVGINNPTIAMVFLPIQNVGETLPYSEFGILGLRPGSTTVIVSTVAQPMIITRGITIIVKEPN